jgi:hypothetical protein
MFLNIIHRPVFFLSKTPSCLYFKTQCFGDWILSQFYQKSETESCLNFKTQRFGDWILSQFYAKETMLFKFQNTAFRKLDSVSVLPEVGDRIQFIFENNISETGFYLRFT